MGGTQTILFVEDEEPLRKMAGKELSEKLFEEYPKLKAFYISGYTDNAIAHHGMLDKGFLLLQKPFSPQSLAEKVRETLGQE